jgi:crossover junction endodeoxyribonuclease RusA
MLKLTINDIPSSNNATQGKGGVKRAFEYSKEKKMWAGYFQALRMRMREQLKGMELPLTEATIIMVHNFKTRARRDPDNFSGKHLLDGLTAAGFLSDDSFKEIDIIPLATFGNEKASVDIYIIRGKKLLGIANKLMEGEKFTCGAI